MIAALASGRGTKEENKISGTAERFCRRFSLAEVQLATQDFTEAHLIGTGGFGKVYKGQIDNQQKTVAIKQLAPNSNQGEGEFFTEIETLSKLRHVNLVSLIGYCNQNGEMILVYEYIPRGTLADHLYKLSSSSESDDCSSLTWKQRLNICIGAARGIDYLHTDSSIIHRDVKSTNILLDENFTAKVSDFGLAKHFTSNSKSHVSTIVKGTFGYLDPSYFTTCRLTRKSDTYAFGVVLLEVLCGRPAVDQRLGEDEMSLIMWAQEKINKGKASQIVASNLRDEISADCLKTFVGIAKRCLNREPKKRPTMAQVVVHLEFALEQLEKNGLTLNASRFLPFWNRVKPSGSRASGSTQKDNHTVNMLHVAVPAISKLELKEITDDFSSKCFMFPGFNGDYYRGALQTSGHVVAIKKLHRTRRSQPNKEFLEKVTMVSSLKHENVAQLLGYCVDRLQQFLVYEFTQNGSLHDILHGQAGWKPVRPVSWALRVKIAVGAAKGLEYIHKNSQIHCNVTSTNILIYDGDVAKLADFGNQSYYYPFIPQRCGYQPPGFEYISKFSERSDVYSFGVVLIELLTGSKMYDYTRPRGPTLHVKEWALPKLSEDRVEEVVDDKLNGQYPPKDVAKMAAIAALCVQDQAALRPDMSIVVRALHSLLKEGDLKEEVVIREI